MILFLANLWGWIVAHWRWVLGAVVLTGLLAFAFLGLRACNKPPKLDQKEIIKAQQAIAKEDRKQMIEILTNSAVQEQGIDNSIKAAEEATEKAKQNYQGKTNEELAAELEKRLHE